VCRGRPRASKPSSPEIEQWEFDLIAEAARTIDPSERDEFQLELARKLLVLKRRSGANVLHWRAYVKQFLKTRLRTGAGIGVGDKRNRLFWISATTKRPMLSQEQ